MLARGFLVYLAVSVGYRHKWVLFPSRVLGDHSPQAGTATVMGPIVAR
jgi:hypothetical protein